MTRYFINVYSEEAEREPRTYSVPASSEDDARLLAFVLDGGIEDEKIGVGSTIEDGELELAKMYTEVIGVLTRNNSAHFGRRGKRANN